MLRVLLAMGLAIAFGVAGSTALASEVILSGEVPRVASPNVIPIKHLSQFATARRRAYTALRETPGQPVSVTMRDGQGTRGASFVFRMSPPKKPHSAEDLCLLGYRQTGKEDGGWYHDELEFGGGETVVSGSQARARIEFDPPTVLLFRKDPGGNRVDHEVFIYPRMVWLRPYQTSGTNHEWTAPHGRVPEPVVKRLVRSLDLAGALDVIRETSQGQPPTGVTQLELLATERLRAISQGSDVIETMHPLEYVALAEWLAGKTAGQADAQSLDAR